MCTPQAVVSTQGSKTRLKCMTLRQWQQQLTHTKKVETNCTYTSSSMQLLGALNNTGSVQGSALFTLWHSCLFPQTSEAASREPYFWCAWFPIQVGGMQIHASCRTSTAEMQSHTSMHKHTDLDFALFTQDFITHSNSCIVWLWTLPVQSRQHVSSQSLRALGRSGTG